AASAIMQKLEASAPQGAVGPQVRPAPTARQTGPPPDTRPIKTWRGILILAAFMLGSTFLMTGLFYVKHRMTASSQVLGLTLSKLPPAGKLKSWDRIETSGAIPRGLYAAYREGGENHLYLPLTPEGWSKSDPVTAFVHHKFYGSSDDGISLPAALDSHKTI